jgi:hypothetical protein
MRRTKHTRQFPRARHNISVIVLEDAELDKVNSGRLSH